MEQSPVRFVAGVMIVAVMVFTASMSYSQTRALAVRAAARARGQAEAQARARVEARARAEAQARATAAAALAAARERAAQATVGAAAGVGRPDAELALGGAFAWPVIAPVSSPFGPRWGRNHAGVDLAANMGEPIKAARDGLVLLAGEVTGYGETVILTHGDGTRTLYGHCSALRVSTGEQVQKGQVIALVGSTGYSTGPHLHFEIIVNDTPRDPLLYLPKR